VAFGGAGDSKAVDPATTLTLNFGVDRYLGSGGCNWFLGVYDVSGDQMELRAPTQTILECTQPADVMQQESMYLSALWNIDEYRKLDEKLLAYAIEDQLLLTFVPATPVPIEGTTWSLKFQLADEQITPLIADTTVTAALAGGRITGSAGCSTYDGAYTLNGDQFAVSDLTTTKQECTTPDGIMGQEALYLANLAAATRLIQTAGVLQLLNADGETVLAFAAY
jgi:heat shock protein HslJ